MARSVEDGSVEQDSVEQDSVEQDSLEQDIVEDFPLIHLVIGGIGNATFLIGSVFFLIPGLERAALWLFVVGSLGMLIGSLGEAFVRHQRRRTRSRRS